MRPWAPSKSTLQKLNEKIKNVGGAFIYIVLTNKTNLMDLKQRSSRQAFCSRVDTKDFGFWLCGLRGFGLRFW
jgi:hypothetical protein